MRDVRRLDMSSQKVSYVSWVQLWGPWDGAEGKMRVSQSVRNWEREAALIDL